MVIFIWVATETNIVGSSSIVLSWALKPCSSFCKRFNSIAVDTFVTVGTWPTAEPAGVRTGPALLVVLVVCRPDVVGIGTPGQEKTGGSGRDGRELSTQNGTELPGGGPGVLAIRRSRRAWLRTAAAHSDISLHVCKS